MVITESATRALATRTTVQLNAVIDVPLTPLLLSLGLAAAAEFLRRGAVLRADVDGLV